MRKKLLIIISLLIVFKCNLLCAYDGEVHKVINENATKASQLDSVLKGLLGMEDGIDTKLIEKIVDGVTIDSVVEWIAYGGEAEDYGMLLGKNDPPTRSRAFNHFHDPLKSWDEAGLDNMINMVYWGNYLRSPVSSILWGLKPDEQNFLLNLRGDWSWGKAREYYFIYLTGRNFEGEVVASTDYERKEYFADCLRGLGQVMHLLQDASVPLHTRNDVHILPICEIDGKVYGTYETYTKKNKNDLDYIPDQPGDRPSSDLLTDPQPDSSYTHLVPITGLFDSNQYNGDAIPSVNAAIGLAEYSNANFLTEDTMWKYPHPSLNDTNYDSAIWNNPEEIDAEDGEKDNRIYFRKDVGDSINHIMAASYWYYQLYMWNSPELKHAFILDEKCYADYASKLLPRAVGYSAALLDYFFRGKLEVSALALFSENASYGLRVKIKNITQTKEEEGEAMIKGVEDQFALVCQYTPDGANADGSEDKFISVAAFECRDGNCDEIQYEDEVTVDFYLPWEEENRIKMEIYESGEDSVKCMLVFKGTLGQEESAVVGKYFTLGQDQIRFNEEWDNELTGNYPWQHTQPDDPQNPDNGTTSNKIEATSTSINSLIKDNVRYSGYDTARINETSVDFNDVITPNTYLQFKIDDLSKTETSTFHWQALVLHFNDGRKLQMTQSGQGYAINDTTATYSFTLGANLNLNIFELFQNAGISIPDPFYIERIDFVQQLFQESQATTTETSQHMEVDYIRLIEEKYEE